MPMTAVRTPAVAGMFYPNNARKLHEQIQHLLAQAESNGLAPKAIIVPHAGYIYSGPVAASAYARLRAAKDNIPRVVLLGPSHRVGFRGLAVSQMDAFATPLGDIPLDHEAIAQLPDLPYVGFL